MTQAFNQFIQDFAQSKGMPVGEHSIGLEFACEGHNATLFQHPRHENELMVDVSVTILNANPPAEQLALLLQINEAARFEHDWNIVLDADQQVSLSTTASFSDMSIAALEALMLDGVERAQLLQPLLDQLLEVPTTRDAPEASAPKAGSMMIRG